MSYTEYCVIGTLIYYAASSVVAYCSINYLPLYDTGSIMLDKVYYRGDWIYNTEYVSLGKFFYYWFMCLAGFTFVNIVNLKNERKCPIWDNHDSPASFYKTALYVAPALFMISMNVNLSSQKDLSSTSEIRNLSVVQMYDHMASGKDSAPLLLQSVELQGYFEPSSE